MKKLIILALLPFAVACNKSSDMTVAPDANRHAPSMKKAATSVSFSTVANASGITSNGKGIYNGSYTGANGLLNANGTMSEIVNVTWPSGSNGNGIANGTYTYSSQLIVSDASGTLTLQLNGTWWFSGPASAAGSGNWTVVSGTGGYAGVKGSGTMTIDEILFNESGPYQTSDTYTGSLYY